MLATAFAYTAEHAIPGQEAEPYRAERYGTISDHTGLGISRVYDAKVHLFREGDAATHVYRVEAGNVCIYRMMADGRRQIIDFAYPGDYIGLGELGEHAANAQASSRARVRCIPISALHDVARRDSHFGFKLYEAVALELQAARELLFTVSQRTAAERLAAFLMALSRRNERHGEDSTEIVLPMTRTDIADFLGLTIETVSRTFTKFRNEDLIGIEQNILVTLRDSETLAHLAEGECALHC
jgi:CRP-like cAMP-binding protein